MGQDNSTNQPNKPAFRQDLRIYQIASLLTLLLSGLFFLNFDISIWQIIITIGTAQPAQYAGTRYFHLPVFDPKKERDQALGVTLEAQYTIGKYDILILSAKESYGLKTGLSENRYRITNGAYAVLHRYLKQNMKFFVAKVNLTEQSKLGFTPLRPIQIAFESPKFMLAIRLETINADGAQELFIYNLTKQDRIETANYRTVRLPEAEEIPLYIEDKFGEFYRDLFTQQVKRESDQGVFLEYA